MDPHRQTSDPQVTLLTTSSQDWLDTVLNDFDTFLVDHAACERKAAAVATSMICHYPDREKLVAAMADLAVEEMSHFREVVQLIHRRGVALGADRKDPYVNALRKHVQNGRESYMLDRLLIASIVEARGTERFAMIGAAVSDKHLQRFYRQLARSEARHQQIFLDLALLYLNSDQVLSRLGELQLIEAEIIESLPYRAALH